MRTIYKRGLIIIGIGLVLLVIPSIGFSFQCPWGLVYVGDSAGKVLKRCGKPQHKTVNKIGLSSREEVWYYDFGGKRIPHNVTIRDGKVIKIEVE
jgi:hypothetical protein